jgi:CRP-like cAMP-binding protein
VVSKSETVIDRIRDLEAQRSDARINSVRHQQLTKAIHVQADLYRQSLDLEQASQEFDPRSATRTARGPARAAVRGIRPRSPERPGNRLLASLPMRELRRLLPHLTTVQTHVKHVFHIKGEALGAVYFPNGGVASITALMNDGRMVEVATVGDEGMVGIEALLGPDPIALGDTMMQVSASSAERMSVEHFRRAIVEQPAFGALVGRYAQVMIAEMMQSTACNALHPVQQRCARWLLTTHDRMHLQDFTLSHEFLAVMLGVARPTVSLVAAGLQDAGSIRYVRGRMTVLDRNALQRSACECYGLVRAQFERLRA